MISRLFSTFFGLSLAFAATPASAQGELPPGHPPVTAPAPNAARAVPSTSAPAHAAGAPSAATASATGSPAHPASAPSAPSAKSPAHAPAPAASASDAAAPAPANPHAAPANPHAGGAPTMPSVPQDENLPAADLPKGNVEALILDGQRAPLAGVEVHLAIQYSKISEGESKSERVLRTDAEGRVRFDGLTAASEYSYRVIVHSSGAEYTSGGFNLNERVGQRIRLHVFPVTRDIRSALVGMRGFVAIEPRDDVFVFDVVYYVFNIGAVTWVPENVVLRLPAGFKAFNTQQGESDAGWEVVEGQGARLKGTFPPGRENIGFRFQLPKSAESAVNFRIGALPRTAELRVIAVASSQMHLNVEGFEEPQVSSNQQGNRVLITRRLLQRGDELDGGVSISIDGIPVPGSGRWVALAIAAALAAVGLASAWGYMRLDPSDLRQDQDLQSARELLLKELVDVERARRQGELGPRAHAEAKRTLLDALARLGRDVLAPPKPRKKRRHAAA